jgi:hypothetical protein
LKTHELTAGTPRRATTQDEAPGDDRLASSRLYCEQGRSFQYGLCRPECLSSSDK